MNSPILASEPLTRPIKDADWRALLSAIRKNNVVPMVGTDLMRIQVEGRPMTYDHFLAEELAKRHQITDADFATLGTSLSEAALNDVVSICVKREGDRSRFELHDDVWQIVNDSNVAPPKALMQLAQITDIDLFVTSTCDPLLESALRAVGPVETRVYRRNEKEKEKEDLPKEARIRRGGRFLYYLMGKAEPGTMEFAICDEDLLRFMRKLHDSKYRPKKLFDALRESDLLLLGVNFGDWLARFFLWLAKDRDNLNSEEARNLREYLADHKSGQDRSLVLFLRHFSQSTIVSPEDPENFVDELYRRWSGQVAVRPSPGDTNEPRVGHAMTKGAIFISYSRNDLAAAKCFFVEISRAGLPAWYDAGLKGGDEFDPKLDYNIENCSVFIPIISAGSLAREQGYFRKEWKKAVERDERFFGSSKSSIIPVIIDGDDDILKAPQTYLGMPKHFRDLHMYHCPMGRPSPELMSSLRTHLEGSSPKISSDE